MKLLDLPPCAVVRVKAVDKGGWAEKNSIEPGTVIEKINGKVAKTMSTKEFTSVIKDRPLRILMIKPPKKAAKTEAGPKVHRRHCIGGLGAWLMARLACFWDLVQPNEAESLLISRSHSQLQPDEKKDDQPALLRGVRGIAGRTLSPPKRNTWKPGLSMIPPSPAAHAAGFAMFPETPDGAAGAMGLYAASPTTPPTPAGERTSPATPRMDTVAEGVSS